MSSFTLNSKTTVLIIGAGPSGLTAALLLAHYGLQSIIVEQHMGRIGQPKAHAINPRSLEIFRQIGLDTEQLREKGVKPEDGDTVRFVVSMSGRELATLPYERQGEETKTITPEPLFNIPQPLLEDFLLAAVVGNEMITLHRGVRWERCSQVAENLFSSRIIERTTGNSSVIESAYILDCGGANSRAREQLEIPFSPLPEYRQNEVHHLSVHMKADLTRFKPGTLWWISSPSAEGTFICYNRSSDWVFVTYYDPKTTSREIFTEEYCRTLVDNAIGEKVPYDVLSITVWATWPRTADFYQSKRFPHAFVVGDAAHVFPPTGGLGVNTGIADAQNLIWKINAVEQLGADQSILASYTTERRPVAVANARQSVRNQVKLKGLKTALRNPPSLTSVNSGDWIEWKTRLDHELQENAEHFDSINLQIGYVYGADENLNGPCDLYTPRGIPGARLPHTWISRANEKVSILDLVDGKSFVLFVSEQSSNDLPQALISGTTSVPLHIIRVGVDFDLLDACWLDVVGLSAQGSGSGLLVKPDQHIVGHVKSIADAERLITATLQPQLGLRSHETTHPPVSSYESPAYWLWSTHRGPLTTLRISTALTTGILVVAMATAIAHTSPIRGLLRRLSLL